MRWDDIFAAGNVFDITAKVWRARVKIQPKDLGIPATDEVRKALALGSHRLAPPGAFKAVNGAATRARRALDAFSVHFPLVQGGRFVPDRNTAQCVEALRAARQTFDDAADAFCERYAQIKAEQTPVLRAAILQATSDEAATDAAMARLEQEYPRAGDIRSMFTLDWSVLAITSPRSQAAKEAIQGETDKVKSVVRDVVERMRADLGKRLDDLMSQIDRGGKIPKRSLEPTRKLLDRLEKLNFVNDGVLAGQIEAVRRLLDAAEDPEQAEAVGNGLAGAKRALGQGIEEAVAQAEAELTGLGRRRFLNTPPSAEADAPAEEGARDAV